MQPCPIRFCSIFTETISDPEYRLEIVYAQLPQPRDMVIQRPRLRIDIAPNLGEKRIPGQDDVRIFHAIFQ